MNPQILFQPLQSPKLALANRIVMAPMTRQFCPGGVPGPEVARYYQKRAKGGVGLIITEGTTIDHPAASFDAAIPHLHSPEAQAGWRAVVQAVHQAGGKIMPQLWHVGAARKPGTGPYPEAVSASPSGIISTGKQVLPPSSTAEVQDLVQAFAQAAKTAQKIGFDGVEIHGAHEYLVDQFLWEGTNQRGDQYGGSLENRTRFAVEIVQAIRGLVGPDFPIIFRFSQWKKRDFNAKLAYSPQELEKILTLLSEAGVDIFHASTRRYWLPEFEGSPLNLAGWAQKLTGKPAISVGSVGLEGDFEKAFVGGEAQVSGIEPLLQRMERGEFDLIALGRILIPNPDWPSLVQAGRFQDIQPFLKGALAALD